MAKVLSDDKFMADCITHLLPTFEPSISLCVATAMHSCVSFAPATYYITE